MSMFPEVTTPMTQAGDDETGGGRPARRLMSFTVADGLMLAIAALAAWLRFGDLSGTPLSAAEATAALSSHAFWAIGATVTPPVSPAYFSFTNIIMGLGGDGDVVARLVPAFFGLLTACLPWLWLRREAGQGSRRPVAWLVAGLFMAVSPALAIVSRTAGGDAIALFALLLFALAALDGGAGRGRAIALGAGLGLGLTSSPLFYTGLVALLAALWLGGLDILPRGRMKAAALAAAMTFLIVASFGALYLPGIGASLRLLPLWLGQFGWGVAGGESALSPWLVLLRYEPAVYILGGTGMIWAVWHHRAEEERAGGRPSTLAVWLGALLILMAAQPGAAINAVAATLPGYLLAGALASAVAGAREAYPEAGGRLFWSVAGGLAGLSAVTLAAFGRFARLNLLSGEMANLILLSSLAFVLAGLIVVAMLAWESAAARRGALAGVALALLFWQWGTAQQLTRLGANDPRERWVVATTGAGATDAGATSFGATDDGARVMLDLLRDVSWQTAGSGRDLKILSLVQSPALDWYLRDYVGYQAGAAAPLDSQADVVIAPEGLELALPNDYFGADFILTRHKTAGDRPPTLEETLKWLLFRESAAPTEAQRVVLWIRSDLAK